jgi:riboflavin kinase/FMN adenylyltransferase
VVHGAGRGKGLGFPTANLAVDDQLVPAEGVYAGRAVFLAGDAVAGPPVPAAISIGKLPTFDGTEVVIEAFLLDFDGDLYEARLRLDFLDWLRPQEKYPSAAELVAQMERDVARTRELFRAARQT